MTGRKQNVVPDAPAGIEAEIREQVAEAVEDRLHDRGLVDVVDAPDTDHIAHGDLREVISATEDAVVQAVRPLIADRDELEAELEHLRADLAEKTYDEQQARPEAPVEGYPEMRERVARAVGRAANPTQVGFAVVGIDSATDAVMEAVRPVIAERDALKTHSVRFNHIAWRIAVAVGDVPDGAQQVTGDTAEQLDRLIAKRDAAETRHVKMTRHDEGLIKSERRRAEQAEAELAALQRIGRSHVSPDPVDQPRTVGHLREAIDGLPDAAQMFISIGGDGEDYAVSEVWASEQIPDGEPRPTDRRAIGLEIHLGLFGEPPESPTTGGGETDG